MDIDYGDQFLDPVSYTYESFDELHAVIFKDGEGNEHRYELSTDVDLVRNNLYQDSCEEETIFITHKSEYYLRRFSSINNTAIAVVLLAGFLDGENIYEEDRLIDILKVSVFDDNMPSGHLSRICVMTSSRGGSLDNEEYNSNEFIEHDSLSILHKTFYNVFEQRQGTAKMYYTSTDGIVSFTDNSGTQLVLDRVE